MPPSTSVATANRHFDTGVSRKLTVMALAQDPCHATAGGQGQPDARVCRALLRPASENVCRVATPTAGVDCTAIEVPTLFQDFNDYWTPFTLGAGPAPGYCASLPPARERLKAALEAGLPRRADGAIPFKARAWAIRGVSGG